MGSLKLSACEHTVRDKGKRYEYGRTGVEKERKKFSETEKDYDVMTGLILSRREAQLKKVSADNSRNVTDQIYNMEISDKRKTERETGREKAPFLHALCFYGRIQLVDREL
ncbi:hypothetical protein RUM44_001171 [Polyplax serrata]|uniref:Uncharacterized protein n=1 Tax=Polyplax serrata TaxID=468196 RepID=A0ABR1B6R7_POLSC